MKFNLITIPTGGSKFHFKVIKLSQAPLVGDIVFVDGVDWLVKQRIFNIDDTIDLHVSQDRIADEKYLAKNKWQKWDGK